MYSFNVFFYKIVFEANNSHILTGDRLGAKPDNKSYYNIVFKETKLDLDDVSCTVNTDKTRHQSYADCVDQ